MKTGSMLAMILLTAVSILHLLRLAFGVEVVADGVEIPVWVSLPGCLVPGAIAALLWREGHAAHTR